jgi:thiosulfate dehydrogenase
MGPKAKSHELQFAGNNLSCKNCHLESGTKPGSASFVGVTNRFPQYRNREGKMGTIQERINGCMERSMNGKALPENSTQMKAIVAYMEWLSEDVPENVAAQYKGFVSLKIPDEKADLLRGKEVYERVCETCHAEDGQGQVLAGPDSVKGYLYPPLWGNDSYNHGAGMNRVITAAQFIKGNMPLGVTAGTPQLTDEEAFHVAAYIDSFKRPMKPDTDKDFPDKKLKPVSTPYGPWEDPFPADQHKYGPFPPIIKYYQQEYGIEKSK